ncbi:MAG: head-tail connector protein [Proteobacteria bacterium]|nr:head-tail connector protein [Pseudomonadota bacterium]
MARKAEPQARTPGADDEEYATFAAGLKRAQARRDLANSVIDECYEFAMPLRERPYSDGQDYRVKSERLFDATAPDAIEDGASAMADDVWPLDAEPFTLEPGKTVDPAKKEEFAKALAAITDDITTTIYNSNYRKACEGALQDWHIGSGFLLLDEGDFDQPLVSRVLPLSEALPDLGPRDEIDKLYRKPIKVRASDIKLRWPDAKLPEQLAKIAAETPDRDIEFQEGAARDWSVKSAETWVSRVAWPEGKAIIRRRVDKGHGSKPFVDFHYSNVPGHVLARGPVQTALPWIKTVNTVMELALYGLELNMTGAFQAEDDGVINPDTTRIEPQSVLIVGQGSGGLKSLTGDIRVRDGQWILDGLRADIRRTITGDDLGPVKNSPMSATEVLERAAARARRRSGPYSGLIVGLMQQTVSRVAWIRQRQGAFKMSAIDGQGIAFRPLAPITRALGQDKILRFGRSMELINGALGPQTAQLVINQEEAARWVTQQFGLDPRLVRSKVEMKKLVQQIAQLATAAPAA